jgi:signal transduction histidine kinase
LLALRRLEQQLEGNTELVPLARSTRGELEAAIADLRELARGLHPPLLAKHGLARAVRAGAARSSIPVELDLRIATGLPPEIEAAAYDVCTEAVTNTVKHARASKVWLRVWHEGEQGARWHARAP